MTVTRTYRFHEVFEEEVQAVNQRRRRFGRAEVALELEPDVNSQSNARAEGEPIMRPTADSGLAGLALSGGGIRSASFCLGALQALDKAGVLKHIDYLSTVSGGGYIGTSLSAAMTHSKGDFPFTSSLTQDEPYPVQHIRNHSNYLFPHGSINIFYNVAIYLRGLLANALLILPWLLVLAAITIFFKPDSESLHVSIRGTFLAAFNVDHFGATLIALCVFGLLLLIWGLWRSLDITSWEAEIDIGSPWTLVSAIVLILLLFIVFCELQPFVLDSVFESAARPGGIFSSFVGWLQALAAVLAPFSAAVAFFSRPIGRLLKQGAERPSLAALASRAAGRAAVYIAGAAIPFLLWMAYLYLCFVGIRDVSSGGYHAPLWLRDVSQHWFGSKTPIGWFYLVTGIVLFLLSLLLAANANSLHRLYRDRLSKAFLFDPTTIAGRRSGTGFKRESVSLRGLAADDQLKYEDFELAPIDRFKLSEISCVDAPFHLINTALNIQGSKYANRRGRNADFFVFSPKFIGSSATQYVKTEEFEDDVKELDLATAMAVSGAAASANMGASSIKALTPTLAILNVRLGYWVANPGQLAQDRKPSSVFASVLDQFYFLQELLGLMRETSTRIFLSDGGHIENLGIYELLRRRCELIIAVDAEADPQMSFRSIVAVQRYARIDLGVLIDLPWAEIRDATRAASEEIAKSGGLPPNATPHGPHCAVGEIRYPQGRTGILIYVKSSITGDENDYIVDYKRRFPSYPHETTADQLFSEEQFEVYRALGFHAVTEVFSGRDQVGMRPKAAQWHGPLLDDPLVKGAKDLLNWA